MTEPPGSVTVREPVPDDAPALQAMFRRCSAESAYARFLAPVAEFPPRHLADVVHRGPDRWSWIAIDRETAWVIAVASLFRLDTETGELALLVEDAEQRRGLGSALLDLLAAYASVAGFRALVGLALVQSHHVLRMLRRLGRITTHSSGSTCEVIVALCETRAVPVPQPTVVGPIVGQQAPWGTPATDVAERGYRVEEFQLEGSAGGHQLRPGTDAAVDGRWEVERYAEAPYRTRILVVRPEHPERFNGTVVVNWQNVSAGFEHGGPADGELFEGYAWVGVSAQEVGLYGFPPGMDRYGGRGGTPLVEHDPERYGSLHHPGDQASFDIFSQAGHAVGPHRTGTVDPMGGLAVRRLVAMGGSQSAMRLVAYYNAFQRDAAVFDAFLLSVWEGRAPRPEEGAIAMGVRTTIRTDLATPVVVVNSEFEATHLAGLPITDTEHLRVWEVAGTPHGVARVVTISPTRVEGS